MKAFIFLALCCLPSAAFTQATSAPQIVAYYQKNKNFSGVVLIAHDDKIEYLGATGTMSRGAQTQLRPTTRFRIASVTKTFTAVLTLQMVEKGLISLDSTIGKYLPSYDGEARNRTTIRQLLNYSSGIPNCEEKDGEKIYRARIPVDSFIRYYCSGPLRHEPGSTFNYDNGDYIILGRILEKTADITFDSLLRSQILTPLKMKNSGILLGGDIITGIAKSSLYNDSLKSFQPDPPYYISNYFSAGAMYSTAEDLFRFDQAIFNGKLLTAKTMATMLRPDPTLGNVALGFWESDKYEPIDRKFYYRPGGIYGSTANWIHVEDPSRTIIVLANNNAANLFELSQQLYAASVGKKTITLPAEN